MGFKSVGNDKISIFVNDSDCVVKVLMQVLMFLSSVHEGMHISTQGLTMYYKLTSKLVFSLKQFSL